MRYTNINPELTPDLLRSSNFNFDGFYYVNPLCPVRFNAEGDAYKPSFADPSFPRFTVTIKKYAELIGVMHQMLQMYVQAQLAGKNFTTERDAQAFIVTAIHEYYKFDKDIDFVLQFTQNGMMAIPNNEYTYTLLDGNVGQFSMTIDPGEDSENINIEFETHPQCISYVYLMEVMQDYYGERGIDCSNFQIRSVRIKTSEGYENFFGAGIPKLRKNVQVAEKKEENS